MSPDELNQLAREAHPEGATLAQRAEIAKRGEGYQPTPHVCQQCDHPLSQHDEQGACMNRRPVGEYVARCACESGPELAQRQDIALDAVDRLRTAEQYIGALPNSILYGVADAIEEYVMRRHGIEGVPQPTWLLEFLYESGLTVVPGGPHKDRADSHPHGDEDAS